MNLPKNLSKEDQEKLKIILEDLSKLIKDAFGSSYAYYFSLVCRKNIDEPPINISSVALPKESTDWEYWLTTLMTAITKDNFLKHTILTETFSKLMEELEEEFPEKPSNSNETIN